MARGNRSLRFDVSALDRASAAFTKIAASVEALAARLEALDKKKVEPEVSVKTTQAEKQVGKFADDMQKRLAKAVQALPEVQISSSADSSALQRLRSEMASLSSKKIGVDVDAAAATAQISQLLTQLKLIHDETANIQIKADTASAIAELAAIQAQVKKLDGESADVAVNVDTDASATSTIKGLINNTALLSRNLRQLVIPYALFAATPAVASLGNAMVQLSGVLALVPGVALAAGASIATVALGMQNFGTAIDMAHPEKAAKAFEKLAPSAKLAATAVRQLIPEFQKLRNAVQNNLFDGIGQSITRLSGAYLPTLTAGFGSLAAEINNGIGIWAQWAAQADTVRDTGTIFEGIRGAVQQLAPAITNIAAALTDIGVVGASMLPELVGGFTAATAVFRDFIAQARDSGQLEAFIQRGLDALTALGRIALDVGSSLTAVFSAADAAGTPFLQTLERGTEALRTFLNSTEGQSALIGMFTTIKNTVEGILPGLQAVGRAFLDSFSSAGPGLTQFGQALGQVLVSLAPAIPMITALVTALAPLATAFAAIVSALGPVPALLLTAVAGFKLLSAVQTLVAAPFQAASVSVAKFGADARKAGTDSAAAGTQLAVIGTAAKQAATDADGAKGKLSGFGSAMDGARGGADRLSRVLGGVSGFLAGPWVGAITTGAAILSLLIDGTNAAGQRAAALRSEMDMLAATLNQQTGAMTQASVAAKAKALADAGLLTVGRQLGITENTLTQASLGNAEAQKQVQAAFVRKTTALVESSAAYSQLAPLMQRAGVSSADLARAVLEGGTALDTMRQRLAGVAPDAQIAATQFDGLVSSVAGGMTGIQQLASELGLTGAELRRVVDATIQAAAAATNYGSLVLSAAGALQQFGTALDQNTGSIIQGAAGAQQLSTALQQVATGAQITAVAAGIAAAAQNGLAAGSAAAGAAMQQNRQTFIDAATAAGMGATEAGRLADAMGLIPAVARILFELRGAPEATQQLGTIAALIQAMPGQKEFTVRALTDEAIAKLREMGVAVEQLQDGSFKITVDDSEFKTKIEAALAAGATLKEAIEMTLSLNDSDFTTKLDEIERRLKVLKVPPRMGPISFDTGQAEGQLDSLEQRLQGFGNMPPIPMPQFQPPPDGKTLFASFGFDNQQPVTIPVQADPTLANNTISALLASVAGMLVQIPLNANNAQALTAVSAISAAIAAIALMQVLLSLNNAQALAAIAAVVAAGMGANTTATHTQLSNIAALIALILTLNAMNTTAMHTQTDNIAALSARIGVLNGLRTTAPHVQTDNIPAVTSRIRALNSMATRAAHTHSDNTAAVRGRIMALNGLNTTSTHTIRVVTVGGAGAAAGAGAGARPKGGGVFAGGGILRAAKGAVLAGYSPGRDTIPALLSPGESVLTPEATRLLGKQTVLALNKMASGRRGIVGGSISAETGARNGSISTGGYGFPDAQPQPVNKHYHLTVTNAGNSEVDLREQFRRLELMGG